MKLNKKIYILNDLFINLNIKSNENYQSSAWKSEVKLSDGFLNSSVCSHSSIINYLKLCSLDYSFVYLMLTFLKNWGMFGVFYLSALSLMFLLVKLETLPLFYSFLPCSFKNLLALALIWIFSFTFSGFENSFNLSFYIYAYLSIILLSLSSSFVWLLEIFYY